MPRNGWLTPNTIPAEKVCRVLRIPAEYEYIVPAVMGALYPLTQVEEWEQFGTVTPQQMASAMLQMFLDIANVECEPVTVPVGSIMAFGAASCPDGWLYCDGAEVLKADYPALWNAITDFWGVAALGSDYFVLPDFKDRSPFGFHYGGGATKSFGHYYGAETVTLTESQMPVHKHKYGLGGATGTARTGFVPTFGTYFEDPRPETDNTGGGEAHANLHPVAVCGFIIKAS